MSRHHDVHPARRALWLVGFFLCLASGLASAQTNLETNAGIQFNFSTPGAANLAMGGAFLALADDATAAYTNPAGLTQVLYQELHFEARAFEFTHVYTDSGYLIDPDKCDYNVDPPCKLELGSLRDRTAQNRTAGASYLSYVYRWKKLSAALYRHELAHFEANFDTLGARIEPTRSRSNLGIPGQFDGRLASLQNTMDLLIVNYGIAAAWAHRRLSIGIGLSFHDLTIDSQAKRFVPPLGTCSETPPTVKPLEEEEACREDVFTGDIVSIQKQTQGGSDWTFTLGALWEFPGGKWRIGGVFRDGPSFDFTASSERGENTPFQFHEASQIATFNVPRAYGIGVAYLPSDSLRITFDYDRILYSDLVKDIKDIFDLKSLFTGFNPELDKFEIPDAHEIHLGLEKYFLKTTHPIAVRVGAWYDPDHSMRFTGDNHSFQAIFKERSDEIHYTFGIGISHESFQVHLAFDLSDRVSTGALSGILHF